LADTGFRDERSGLLDGGALPESGLVAPVAEVHLDELGEVELGVSGGVRSRQVRLAVAQKSRDVY
jgi:hypothetical protein